MKFTDRGRTLTLEGITAKDIKYRNLAARATNSPYYDPDKPQRVYSVWVDEETAGELKDRGFNVKEAEDTYNDAGVRFYIQFKAYAKMRVNRKGENEQYPKIRLLPGDITLSQDAFGLADSAHVTNVDIGFHPYQYDPKRPSIAVIDELWCTVDESADGQNDDYFEAKYGELGDEDVPFE